MTATFDLDYLVDNGQLHGWLTATEAGCRMVRWTDDDTFSVQDANGNNLGWGETKEDALQDARMRLTDRRRKTDGITPACYCQQLGMDCTHKRK